MGDNIVNMSQFAAALSKSRNARKAAIMTYGTPVEKMIITSTEAFMDAFSASLIELAVEDRIADMTEYRDKMLLFLESVRQELEAACKDFGA